jgi:hypothetical protein
MPAKPVRKQSIHIGRAPCPALNSLANESYVDESGKNITFFSLLYALQHVYNLSFPLATLLTTGAFLTVGKLTFAPFSWTLDLHDLCQVQYHRGDSWRIAHFYSLGHLDPVSERKKRALRQGSLDHEHIVPAPTDVQRMNKWLAFRQEGGFSLTSLARARLAVEHRPSNPNSFCPPELDRIHDEISRGEAGLTWLLMKDPKTDIVPVERVMQWFGVREEDDGSGGKVVVRAECGDRLPEGWWEVLRPKNPIGLMQARNASVAVKKEMERIREEEKLSSCTSR